MQRLTLGLEQAAELPGGLRVRLESVLVEEIAPSPDDPQAYPGGSGVDVHLGLALGDRREALVLNELSPPYQGKREATFEGYRLRLVEVRDPYREMKVVLEVAVPAGASTAALAEAADRFLRQLDPGIPFEIRVGGPALEALVTQKKCAYAEWTTGELVDGELASFRSPLRSEQPLRLTSGKVLVELPLNRVRLFLRPAYQRTFQAGDPGAPEVVRQRLAAEPLPRLTLVEYCLEVGQRAWAVLRVDTVQLPPGGPDERPAERSHRVLLISDRPIPKGREAPAGLPTPGYRGWTY